TSSNTSFSNKKSKYSISAEEIISFLSKKSCQKRMTDLLIKLRTKVSIEYIGERLLEKQKEQLEEAFDLFDYKFPENKKLIYKHFTKLEIAVKKKELNFWNTINNIALERI
uniref:Uncharacterized protein n=1 Tax=Glossina palpalis gambiensis TaxID=67801 RepID=A0A1B0B8C0_9MUSC